MIISEEEFKRQFGANAQLANQSQNGQVSTDYHDITKEGFVDEDNYFHPHGSQTLVERNKWTSLKKGIPKIQEYINSGVPEQVVRSTIERLSKELVIYGEPGYMTTKKVMDKLAEIFNRNKKFYEEKPNLEKELAEKPMLTQEEEEKVIRDMADKMKRSENIAKDVITLNTMAKMSLAGANMPGQIIPYDNFNPMDMIPPTMIRLSGGIYFNQSNLELCFDGKLKLKNHKRAIKLNRKQIKELESQI